MSKLVLYIDDEEALCELFQWHMEASGIVVQTFTDPEEGLKCISESDVAAIFCDYRMPGMNGLALFKSIERDIPFFLVTGDIDLQVEKATQGCLKSVLHKPIDYKKAAQLVCEIFEES